MHRQYVVIYHSETCHTGKRLADHIQKSQFGNTAHGNKIMQ